MRVTPVLLYRCIIIGFNLAIASGGCVLMSQGAEYLQNANDNIYVLGGSFFGILTVVLGALAVSTSIFGCVGACCYSETLLKIYAGIMMVLFTLQLSLGIMSISQILDVNGFSNQVYKIMRQIFEENHPEFNALERDFKCCGIDGYWDYELRYPASCCNNGENPCLDPIEKGCLSAYRNLFEEYIRTTGYVGIVFAALELMGGFFALMVRRSLKAAEPTLRLDNYAY